MSHKYLILLSLCFEKSATFLLVSLSPFLLPSSSLSLWISLFSLETIVSALSVGPTLNAISIDKRQHASKVISIRKAGYTCLYLIPSFLYLHILSPDSNFYFLFVAYLLLHSIYTMVSVHSRFSGLYSDFALSSGILFLALASTLCTLSYFRIQSI